MLVTMYEAWAESRGYTGAWCHCSGAGECLQITSWGWRGVMVVGPVKRLELVDSGTPGGVRKAALLVEGFLAYGCVVSSPKAVV